jgi:hypothetical protein
MAARRVVWSVMRCIRYLGCTRSWLTPSQEWSHAITGNDDSDATDDTEAYFAELVAIANEALTTVEVDDGRPGCWEDVLPIARRLLPVWVDGAELVWAEHAWAALTDAGLTKAETEVDRARVVCRLLALTVLYREFCARAFEEGHPGEWSPDAEDVLGDEEPYVHPFVLGQLAERDGIDADVEVGYSFDEGTPAYALREITRDQYRIVVDALRDRWGGRRCSPRSGRPPMPTPSTPSRRKSSVTW